jgi:regulatory protein
LADANPSFDIEDDAPMTPERMTTLAKNMVLRKLTRAPQTRQQLADYLSERGIAEEIVSEVLGRMTDVGLINDAEFAAMFVRAKRASRGLAPRVLAQELRQRGVDDDIITTELAAISPTDDRDLAKSLVAKKLMATARLDKETRIRRLTSMLVRKGFSAGLAFEVVREAIGELPAED